MDTSEILKRVRKIEIKTRGLSQNVFAGQYHTAFKGHGMAFSEMREYQFSDDVCDIDWNITTRFNRPYIKVFEEERGLTVVLLIDASGPLDFGTKKQAKRETVTEIIATLAFGAIQSNDKIGAIFFSDGVEKYIPSKKRRKRILYIIREMLDFDPENKKTNVAMAIEYLTRVTRRRCTAYVLSDFYIRHDAKGYDRFEHAMSIANHRHGMVAVQIYDPRTKSLSNISLMRICGVETGRKMVIDASSARLRHAHTAYWMERNAQLRQAFAKSGIDWTSVATDEDYVKAIMRLFAQRSV